MGGACATPGFQVLVPSEWHTPDPGWLSYSNYDSRVQHFSLAIIGSGSGNNLVPEDPGRSPVALIESGAFGGTCLNRGCPDSTRHEAAMLRNRGGSRNH
jgi:hypothetical protein